MFHPSSYYPNNTSKLYKSWTFSDHNHIRQHLVILQDLTLLLFACDRHCSTSILIYLLTAVGLTPGGSSTVHIYTQTIVNCSWVATRWQQYSTNLFTHKQLLTAAGLTPGGSSIVHIYTQTIHRTTQLTTLVGRLSGIRTQSSQTKINNELTA